MSNFSISYDNQADGATLVAAGAWSFSFPQANLKDYRVGKKARTSSVADGSAIVKFTLPANFWLQCVGLMQTNLDAAATYRLRVYSDAGFTAVAYDSGVVSVYPAGCLPESQIPPGSSNSGTAKPTVAEIRRFQNNLCHFLATPLQGRYLLLEVFNSTNADGYLEFGRLFVGRVFRPTYNTSYGKVSLQLASRSEKSEAEDGTPYFVTRRPRFSIPFGLEFATKDEAMRSLDMKAQLDISGEALVVWDSDDIQYAWQRNVFGRLKDLDAIEHPMFATYATAFQVEGIL